MRRPDPAVRAGARLAVALVALLGAAAVVLPLALVVRGDDGVVVRFDRDTTAASIDLVQDRPWLVDLLQLVTDLGGPLLVSVLSLVLALGLWRAGRPRLALLVVASRIGAAVLSTGLKQVVDRLRPVVDEPVASALGPSFPSGHALGAAAFWTTTGLVALSLAAPARRRTRALVIGVAVTVPVLVAATRVLLGVHFVSDVVAGLVLGTGWTALCAAALLQWRRDEGRREVDVLDEGLDPVSPRNGP